MSRQPAAGGRGKTVGAVAAAAKVLRALNEAEQPLNASQVARAAGLHRGTAYNILRTLEAERFVARDEESGTFAVSLRVLEMANGALRKSGLLDLVRPLMYAVSEAYGTTVYVAQPLDDAALLVLDWVGAAFRTDIHLSIGRRYENASAAPSMVIAALGGISPEEAASRYERIRWHRRPGVDRFLAGIEAVQRDGFAVDRGNMFNGLTQVSVPIVDRSGRLRLILTAVGHNVDLDEARLADLARDLGGNSARVTQSLRLLRLG